MTRICVALLTMSALATTAAAEAPARVEVGRVPVDDLFVGSSDRLLNNAYVTLRPLATDLRATDADIVIAVHTDRFGRATDNLALSYTQAARLRKAFIGLGVDPSRLRAVGYGEADPVNTDGTAAGERENRRVEVWVRPR